MAPFGDPAAELGRMAAYGTLTRDLLGTYALLRLRA
jgi:hypothetical protein